MTNTVRTLEFGSETERLKSFKNALDALKARTEAKIGTEDLARVKRLDAFSRSLEVAGRTLLHFSFEPITWSAGVASLWIHKQLQATEIGHTVLHGAYDKIENNNRYQSKTWRWDTPIDEQAWHRGHNIRHHQYTNIVGKDPDVRYGMTRLNAEVQWQPHHAHQHVHGVAQWLGFGFWMNAHFTGVVDILRKDDEPLAMLPDREPETKKRAWKDAMRKWVPYYSKEFLLFPLLAGAGWWKVALGNLAAETLRDVYSAATIFCGHVGEDVVAYPEGSRAHGRAAWYEMQVLSANNFEVPLPISILCGGLDRQIEHHLFPKFPPNRLREIAPEVRAICEAHGVPYKTASWPQTLKSVFRELARLRKPDARPKRSRRPRPEHELGDSMTAAA